MSVSKTPRIGELFDAWNLWRKPFLTRKNWFPDQASIREVTDAELERFFAEHDRQVAERAWDEAVESASLEETLHRTYIYHGENPYTEQEVEHD